MLNAARRAARGFTLIELLIVVAIIGLTTALAAPALRTWSANAQVRSSGSNIATALRTAQAEAVKSFQPVAFYRTNATTCVGTEPPVATGTRWVVRVVPNTAITLPGNAITAPAMCGEISEQSAAIQVQGPTAVCFSPSGRPVALTNATPQSGGTAACNVPASGQIVYWVDTTASVNTGSLKRLSVWVQLGGSVRLCDRERVLSDQMPDGCPAANVSFTPAS